MTPHPQRCETCENSSCEHYDMDLHDGEWYFTSLKGCASHSSQQVERDKVLEKAWVRIETMAPDEGIHLGWVLLSHVKAVLDGLRSTKGGE